MLPSAGHIFFAPFTDEALYNETDMKVCSGWEVRSSPAGAILQRDPVRNRLQRPLPRGSAGGLQ